MSDDFSTESSDYQQMKRYDNKNLGPANERLQYEENIDGMDFPEHVDGSKFFNRTNSPILLCVPRSEKDSSIQIDPKEDLSAEVYALIEYRHLRTGESTRKNPALAKQIAGLGRKYPDKDECGHIISAALGGPMDRMNLFPQGYTTNRSQFWGAERKIINYIDQKRAKNGRAFVQVVLSYENKKYPARPTKFEYSYVLFCDDDGEQKDGEGVYFKVCIPGIGTVSFRDADIHSARTRRHSNRNYRVRKNSSSYTSSNILDPRSKKQFWLSVGAVVVTAVAVAALNPGTVVATGTIFSFGKHFLKF